MRIDVKRTDLVAHVVRVCRSNMKKPCKICLVCPFKEEVLLIMRTYGWKYSPLVETTNKERDY